MPLGLVGFAYYVGAFTAFMESWGICPEDTMIESAVTSKGQTTLPKAVREALGVQPGGRVRYVILNHEVWIIPVRPVRRLYGALRYAGPPVTVEEMDRAVAGGGGGE